MDYPGDFCYGVSLHIGGAFMAKNFYEIVTILWTVFADQNYYHFDAIFAVARCGVSWLPTTRFRMGDLISAAPDLNLACVPQTCGLP